MFSKINVWMIVKDHFDTLRDFRTGKIMVGDIILFIFIPIAFSISILFGIKFPLDKTISNILITSLSFFSALLFNLLLLIYDTVRNEKSYMSDRSVRAKFLRQIVSNISYSILISVVCVAILLIVYLEINSSIFNYLISFLVYFLVIQFILTMFMVLKRIYILLAKEFDSLAH